jgi:predicted transcriptional regulator
MADVMIRVPDAVRDRLAVLAEARGTSIRALIQEFAESTLTPEERAERVEATKAYLAEHFGVRLTEEELGATRRKVREAFVTGNEAA